MFPFRKFRLLLFILVLIFPVSEALSQLLSDTASFRIVEQGVNSLYNMNFDDAEDQFAKIESKYPAHPANLLLKGMVTYWKLFPLIPGSATSASFENDLRACIEKCEIKNPADEAEYLLTDLCARGILLLYLSDNGLHRDVMPLAKNTYKYLRRAFDFIHTYPDFYFFTGLYNYYREVYPEFHPIYKTFIFIFPKGDRAGGLKELQTAAEKAVLLKAESTTFLTYIYQNYERDISRSTYFSRILREEYPLNLQFLVLYIKSLLLEGQYDIAENMIDLGLESQGNQYFRSVFIICNGILQEKKYKNYSLSEKYYLQGIRDIESYGSFGSDFDAYACFGMSRISAVRNDEKAQRTYRKKATDLTDNKVDIFAK
jgi:tetratricopeptide (TPR) repeat protein